MTFTIDPTWDVLVMDDTDERLRWFKQRMPHCTTVKTADEAIEALKTNQFRVVFLDHDLHWMHADNTIVKGTGKEVALHLKKIGFTGIVVIHSKHEEAAAVMAKILPKAKVSPYGGFEVQVG
jgi:DNA-binding NtrC family response regulator